MSDVPAAVQNLERRFEGAKAVDGTSFTVHRAAWRGGVDHRIQWIRQDHDAERDLRHDPSAGGSITLDGTRLDRVAAAPIAEHGVARTLQNGRAFAVLSVADNIG